MSTRPTRPPSPRQRVEAARAKDPPPRLRRDPRGSLMSPVQDRPAHRVTSCGRNPRTKKGRRPVRPLHGGAARNRPDPIVLPAAAPAPIRVPARCRLTPGFLGDSRSLSAAVISFLESPAHPSVTYRPMLHRPSTGRVRVPLTPRLAGGRLAAPRPAAYGQSLQPGCHSKGRGGC
jgi:hypothetical protein